MIVTIITVSKSALICHSILILFLSIINSVNLFVNDITLNTIMCSIVLQPLSDQQHRYFIYNMDKHVNRGVVVHQIPFTNPTQVPKILVLLRQQVLFNTVLSSCVRKTGEQTSFNTQSKLACIDMKRRPIDCTVGTKKSGECCDGVLCLVSVVM